MPEIGVEPSFDPPRTQEDRDNVTVSTFDVNTPFETVLPQVSPFEAGPAGRRNALWLLAAFVSLGVGFALLPLAQRIGREAPGRVPAWVPVYPEARIEAPVAQLGGERRSAVILYTHDLPEKVTDFYTRQLQAQNFAVDPVTVQAQVWRLEARGPEQRELTVASGTGQGFTWIELGYPAGP